MDKFCTNSLQQKLSFQHLHLWQHELQCLPQSNWMAKNKKPASPKLPRNLPQKLQVNLRNKSIQLHTHAATTEVTSVGPVGTKFNVAIAAAKNRSKWPFQVNSMVMENMINESNMTNAHSLSPNAMLRIDPRPFGRRSATCQGN